jgi:hypothetical protein
MQEGRGSLVLLDVPRKSLSALELTVPLTPLASKIKRVSIEGPRASAGGDVSGATTITPANSDNRYLGAVEVESSVDPIAATAFDGSSAKTLTLSGGLYTLTSNSELILDLGIGDAEQIHISRDAEFRLHGTLVLHVLPSTKLSLGQTFTLFLGDGAWTGQFDAITLTGDVERLNTSTASLLRDGRIAIVPEPTSITAFLLGAGIAFMHRGRRRSRP